MHFLFPFKTWKSIYSASTEQCGILENLFPGDITLADRGFTVEDAVGLIVLKLLLLLSVLKVKKYIRRRAVQGKYISHARTHVELTCDFPPIYNSDCKKSIEMIYVQLAISILAALCHTDV